MSSTDDDRTPVPADRSIDRRERAQRFWDDHLTFAADALQSRGVAFYAGPDPAAETYFTPCAAADPADAFVRFETDAVKSWLRERWRAEGHPELVALLDPLLDLAGGFDDDAEQSAEVAPELYVMF